MDILLPFQRGMPCTWGPYRSLGISERVFDVIFLIFDYCWWGGSIFETLQIEVGDNWEMSVRIIGERCLIVTNPLL